MSYVRNRRATLGDAWTDYLATGRGPAGGRVTSPNGDVVVFDSTGGADYTIPRPGGVTDTTVEKDTSSPFYGWTAQQENAYYAGQGVTNIETDAVKKAAVILPGDTAPTVDAAVVAASDANLLNIAQTDPKVAAALDAARSGATNTADVAARSAVVNAGNAATDAAARAAWEKVLPGYWDAVIATGQHPNGLSLDAAVAQGLMTPAQRATAEANIAAGPATPVATPAGPTIYLQNGQYVDGTGKSVPMQALVDLGIAPVRTVDAPSSSSSSDLVAPGYDGSLPWGWIIAGVVGVGVAVKISRKRGRRR